MKNPQAYLEHIVECIEAIEEYYASVLDPKKLFLEDDKTKQATLHRLQVLGQSVKNLPQDVLQQVSASIDWIAIADFRNVLVHEYLGVDPEIIWTVVQSHLPELRDSIKKYLEHSND